jgi:hypothetical protein
MINPNLPQAKELIQQPQEFETPFDEPSRRETILSDDSLDQMQGSEDNSLDLDQFQPEFGH